MHGLSCNGSCNGHTVPPRLILAAQYKLPSSFLTTVGTDRLSSLPMPFSWPPSFVSFIYIFDISQSKKLFYSNNTYTLRRPAVEEVLANVESGLTWTLSHVKKESLFLLLKG